MDTRDPPASGDWLECDSSSLLIVDYPALHAVLGTTWGAAPAGYFRLPDLRGVVPRGWDHGRGKAPDAALRTGGDHVGSSKDDAIKRHNHPMGGVVGTAGGGTGVVDAQACNNSPYNYYTRFFQVSSDGVQAGGFPLFPWLRRPFSNYLKRLLILIERF